MNIRTKENGIFSRCFGATNKGKEKSMKRKYGKRAEINIHENRKREDWERGKGRNRNRKQDSRFGGTGERGSVEEIKRNQRIRENNARKSMHGRRRVNKELQ